MRNDTDNGNSRLYLHPNIAPNCISLYSGPPLECHIIQFLVNNLVIEVDLICSLLRASFPLWYYQKIKLKCLLPFEEEKIELYMLEYF